MLIVKKNTNPNMANIRRAIVNTSISQLHIILETTHITASKKKTMYMVVQRCGISNFASICNPPPVSYDQKQSEFTINWNTNLSILYGARKGGQPLRLHCFVENDPAIDDGDDEIFIRKITADGEKVVGQQYVQDFDAGNDADLENHIPYTIYFLDSVVFEGFEDDGFANGDADPMSATIKALLPGQPGPMADQEKVSLWPSGGHYMFYFNLTHGFDE